MSGEGSRRADGIVLALTPTQICNGRRDRCIDCTQILGVHGSSIRSFIIHTVADGCDRCRFPCRKLCRQLISDPVDHMPPGAL